MVPRCNALPMKRPLPVYSSPRLTQDDDDDAMLWSGGRRLQEHEERWSHMSRLAGPHQQDPRVLKLNGWRNLSPMALQCGVPPQLASRIVELHLGAVNNLPEWLDVIFHTFTNLQHLYLDKDELTQAGRIRRLYILYRLPNLLTMDGRPVTHLERSLARPESPNGLPVTNDDWLPCEQPTDPHGDLVQVSLHGQVHMLPADHLLQEQETEPSPSPLSSLPLPTPPGNAHELLHYSISLESAYRILNQLPEATDMCSMHSEIDEPCMETLTESHATCAAINSEGIRVQNEITKTMQVAAKTNTNTNTNPPFIFDALSLCSTNAKYYAHGEESMTITLPKAPNSYSNTSTSTTTDAEGTTNTNTKKLQVAQDPPRPALQQKRVSQHTTPGQQRAIVAPASPETISRSPARSLTSPFPIQFRTPKVDMVGIDPEVDSRPPMSKRPPPVPGREIKKPTPGKLLERWRGRKQRARAGRSIMDEGDSTSEDEQD